MTALQKAKKKVESEEEALRKQVEQLLISQLAAAKTSAKSPSKTAKTGLRSKPLQKLSRQQVNAMLKEKGFFDSDDNKTGKGLKHQYEEIERDGVKLVADQTTGLTWQHSGSEKTLTFEDAQAYIKKLNSEKHAGFDDWRLPTLEEAMSLMETEQRKGDLYIDPIFDKAQRYIWTADKLDASNAWVVYFNNGNCNNIHVYFNFYVRAVC